MRPVNLIPKAVRGNHWVFEASRTIIAANFRKIHLMWRNRADSSRGKQKTREPVKAFIAKTGWNFMVAKQKERRSRTQGTQWAQRLGDKISVER